MVMDLCEFPHHHTLYTPSPDSADRGTQILMGVLTCVSALLGFGFVPNFPAKATFLNEEERKLVNDRITIDRHDFEEERLTGRLALKHLADWKIWSYVTIQIS